MLSLYNFYKVTQSIDFWQRSFHLFEGICSFQSFFLIIPDFQSCTEVTSTPAALSYVMLTDIKYVSVVHTSSFSCVVYTDICMTMTVSDKWYCNDCMSDKWYCNFCAALWWGWRDPS